MAGGSPHVAPSTIHPGCSAAGPRPSPSSAPPTASAARPATNASPAMTRSGPRASPISRGVPIARRRALAPVLLQRLLEPHHRHPYWGPRKLLRLAGQRWPDAAMAGPLYRRPLLPASGPGHRAARVRRPGPPGRPQAPMDAPNAVWTTDFKGQFHLGDGAVLLSAHGRRWLQSLPAQAVTRSPAPS